MRSSYLVFGNPLIEEDEINEVVETLRSGWIGTGPKVAKFEDQFKEYVGAKYAVAVASCTAGLHLSVISLGLGAGDEVLVPVLTFAATANAVIHSGATPVFVDVDPESMTIDLEDAARKITPKTKGIIPVHFAGRACDMKKIYELASKYNLKVINDTAHAIETEYEGNRLGGFQDIASYSFYVTKNLTTSEGGMVTTNNEEIANKIKILALHGMSKDAWKRFSDDGYKHYEVVYPGFKYNMTDIQAALGLHQLKKIDKMYERRKQIWDYYKSELKDLPLILPGEATHGTKHGYHLFIILIDTDKTKLTRDEVILGLHKLKIGTGVHYRALHCHPYYQEAFGYKPGDFPNAEFVSDRTLSIPFSPKLSDDDVKDVVEALKEVFR
ncbi:MAG: DegT/DnrJ/EryC1/StrS aminotransferase family protein [Ignavibacteriaceae bacterium]|nr:DegT/DnrJ/EryC1/StrS aminotransferase family protein [Ignavibacteriaceae bacterium]